MGALRHAGGVGVGRGTVGGAEVVRRCTVCGHPESQAIDKALATQSLRTVATRYPPLSIFALSRHHRYHVVAAASVEADLREEKRPRPTAPPGSARRKIELAVGRVERLIRAAERSGQVHVAIRGLAELRQTIEALARLEQAEGGHGAPHGTLGEHRVIHFSLRVGDKVLPFSEENLRLKYPWPPPSLIPSTAAGRRPLPLLPDDDDDAEPEKSAEDL